MNLRDWWLRFKRTHLIADDPNDAFRREVIRAADVVAQPAPVKRLIPMPCRRPSGAYVMGWCAFAHNDAERAEVIVAWVRALPPLTHKETA